MKKLLKIRDKIFFIKLWGKFGKSSQKNSERSWTLHYLDDINMIQVIHQHSNFSSKLLYFFLNPNKRKKLTFSILFFFLHIFFPYIFFPSTFLSPNFIWTKLSLNTAMTRHGNRGICNFVRIHRRRPGMRELKQNWGFAHVLQN